MPKWSQSRELLGSRIRLHLVQPDSEREEALHPLEQAFDVAASIEQRFSRFIENNELAALNARVGEWVEVSKDLFDMVRFGIEVHNTSNGAFDLSVKTLLESWGYDAQYSLTPKSLAESDLSPCSGPILYEARAEGGGKLKLSQPIELGGLGKGFALDQMAKVLCSLPNVCLDAGGDILAWGHDEKGPWRLLFEHPKDSTKAIGYVDVDGFAVASSSPLRRRWRNKHHLIDPKTAQPANQMLAVYTQAADGITADAYSTALFALGYPVAQALLPQLPVEALLVGPQAQLFKTPGFKGSLFV